MGLKSIVKRLDKYHQRLTTGKAEKIKPQHIEKAIEKLKAKEHLLTRELAETTKPDKRTRLKDKITRIQAQVDKARWLAKEL